MKLVKIIKTLEFFYPLNLAEDWDNVGLQIGDEKTEVENILVALEINHDVIDEAIESSANLIITHHPLFFKEIKNIKFNNTKGNMINRLIKNDIAVYSIHTNIDIAFNGINDWLCEVIGVENINVLVPMQYINYKKVKIETTSSEMHNVIDLLNLCGAGQRKNYIENVNITPSIKHEKLINGTEGKRDIIILETFILPELLSELKKALYKSRIYDYEVLNIENMGVNYGLGRHGDIKPMTLEMLATKIKESFNLDFIRFVGKREQIIEHVGIIGGSGASHLSDAKRCRCNVLITGDVNYHTAQDAIDNDICIIDPGHHIEEIFVHMLEQLLAHIEELTVIKSEVDNNPFEVI